MVGQQCFFCSRPVHGIGHSGVHLKPAFLEVEQVEFAERLDKENQEGQSTKVYNVTPDWGTGWWSLLAQLPTGSRPSSRAAHGAYPDLLPRSPTGNF